MDSNVVFSNVLWRFLERVGAKSITFFVSIMLARLLEPEAYGTVALINAILMIIDVFVDGGFATALIQKKNATAIDYSSVFYFNIASSAVLYIVTFLTAPAFALWYKDESLTLLIRVAALTILVSGVKNVQQAYVSHNMLFKRFFFSTLGGTIAAAAIGIVLAYSGFGVWALVVQSVVNPLIDTMILWYTVRWRPIRIFSLKSIEGLFGYGGRYLVSLLIGRVTEQLNQFFIGGVYTKAGLAYYNQGYQLSSAITVNVNSTMESVLFAALSNNQDDINRIKQMTERSLQVSCYIIMPLMMGLAVCGESLIKTFLTDKWLPSLPYLYVFCIMYALYPISISNINVTKALGVKDIMIKYQVMKSFVSVLMLLCTIRFGTFAVAIGTLASSIFSLVLNAWPNRKLIGYKLVMQLYDIIPIIILTIVMGIAALGVKFMQIPTVFILVLQVLIGAFVYISISAYFKYPSYQYLKPILMNYLVKIIPLVGGEK